MKPIHSSPLMWILPAAALRKPGGTTMRIVLPTLLTACMVAIVTPAQADPYRWCAQYTEDAGGSSNCYFMTIEQCRATVSGIGGYCSPNPFYDGVPIGSSSRRSRKRT
jgi:hypothetical protein